MVDNNKTSSVVDNNSSGVCSACKRDITNINNEFISERIVVEGDLIVVSTVEELKSLAQNYIQGLIAGKFKGIRLLGYYQKGDTPAPIEYYLSDTVDSEDGGSVFEVGEVKLEHVFIGEIDIRYFGAKGDFEQDDTVYIQKALTYANKSVVSSVYFPTGHYLITDILIPPTDCILYGDGEGSILQFKHDRFTISGTVKWMFKLTNQKNVKFESLKLHGGATTFDVVPYDVDGAEFLIYFNPTQDRAVDNIVINKCTITKSWSSGIQSYGRQAEDYPHPKTSNVRITDCYFTETGFHGIGMNEFVDSVVSNNSFYDIGLVAQSGSVGSGLAVDVSAGCEDVVVSNNVVNLAGGGFKCQTHPIPDKFGGGYQYSKRIVFSNNVISNLRTGEFFKIFYGIKLDGIGCSAIGNTINGGSGHGLMTSGQAIYCTIKDNKVFDAGRSGIEIVGNYHDVSNNTLVNSTEQGMSINGRHNNIANNIVSNGKNQGIRILAGSYINITNNTVFDNTGIGIDLKPYGSNVVDGVIVNNNTVFDTKTGTDRTQTRGIDGVATNLNGVSAIANTCFNNTQYDLNMPDVTKRNQERGSVGWESRTFNGLVGLAGQWKIGDIIRNMNAQPSNTDVQQKYTYGWYNIQNNGTFFIPFGFLGEYSGTQHPEGNVSARVGSRYTKIDDTGFNLIWIKHYGNNTTTGWRLLTLQSYGTTANRPTFLTTVDIGFRYYDQTLLRSIIWNGGRWVNDYSEQIVLDSAPTPGATYNQGEVLGILNELRDLKTKLRTAGILAT